MPIFIVNIFQLALYTVEYQRKETALVSLPAVDFQTMHYHKTFRHSKHDTFVLSLARLIKTAVY